VKQKQDEVTDQEIKLQTLRRQRGQVDRDLAAARMEEPAIQMRSRAQVEQVSRQISELQEGMAQNESKRETVIRAPMAGVVTNIAVSVYVTSISFALYLGSRFVLGPVLLGREQRRPDLG